MGAVPESTILNTNLSHSVQIIFFIKWLLLLPMMHYSEWCCSRYERPTLYLYTWVWWSCFTCRFPLLKSKLMSVHLPAAALSGSVASTASQTSRRSSNTLHYRPRHCGRRVTLHDSWRHRAAFGWCIYVSINIYVKKQNDTKVKTMWTKDQMCKETSRQIKSSQRLFLTCCVWKMKKADICSDPPRLPFSIVNSSVSCYMSLSLLFNKNTEKVFMVSQTCDICATSFQQ